MRPWKGIEPTSALNRTVFPAPFGPMTASELPRGTRNVSPLNTESLPKETVRSSTSSAGSIRHPPPPLGRWANRIEQATSQGCAVLRTLRMPEPCQPDLIVARWRPLALTSLAEDVEEVRHCALSLSSGGVPAS